MLVIINDVNSYSDSTEWTCQKSHWRCNYTFRLSGVLLYKRNHEVSQRPSDLNTQPHLFLFGCLWLFVFHSWIGFWAVGKPICGTAGKPATPSNAWRSTVKLSTTSVNPERWCSPTVFYRPAIDCHVTFLVTGELSNTEQIFYYLLSLRTYISSTILTGLWKIWDFWGLNNAFNWAKWQQEERSF